MNYTDLSDRDKRVVDSIKENIKKTDFTQAWLQSQDDKVKAIILHHRRWQKAGMTDLEFCDKVVQIVYKDKPRERVTITGTPPKPN